MRSNYKPIGNYVQKVESRNRDLKVTRLLGLSMTKEFRETTSNIVGTDMSVYRVMSKYQFACDFMSPIRVNKLPVVLKLDDEPNIVSPAYPVFEITDRDKLDPEYLMMWFRRPEFDRYATFKCDAAIRGGYEWTELCETLIPVPSITKQREIVKEYNVIQDRIALNQRLIQKLEETAQAIYKEWFVDKQDESNKVKLNQYVRTNPPLNIKRSIVATYVEMNDLTTTSMRIVGSIKREFIGGSKFQNHDTLLARITPCLENGKTGFVDILEDEEIAAGSTEFIVMRAKGNISPYWVYCLARDENFRSYAISSMVGSSGRERVHEKYLENFELPKIDSNKMKDFHLKVKPLFTMISIKSNEVRNLTSLKDLLLSKLATNKSK
jgi:type I restriction enzyme S subunit